MNLENSLLLVAVVFGLTQLVKSVTPIPPRLTAVVPVVVAFVATVIVAHTVWAHEQVLGGHPLNTLGWWDQVVVALFAGGAAATLHGGLAAVKSIGANNP